MSSSQSLLPVEESGLPFASLATIICTPKLLNRLSSPTAKLTRGLLDPFSLNNTGNSPEDLSADKMLH
jgi:hypothetical protein